MQLLTIAGNVGNVKDLKTVGNDEVLNFSIAVDNGKDKSGERRESTWYDCALWGKRAASLAPYITKGSKLAVSGRPSARAHDGKAYLGLTVNDLTFMSSKADGERRSEGGSSSSDGYQEPVKAKPDYDDTDIPFLTMAGHYSPA